MKLMQYNRIPRKYHLFWDSNQKAIIIQIHRDCLGFVGIVPSDAPWVRFISESHELDGLFDCFSGDLSGEFFGFNRQIMKVREQREYVEFRATMPSIKIETRFACQNCGGTGEDLSDYPTGDKCLSCRGLGTMHVYDWRSAFALTTSLGLLFEVLNFKEDTSSGECQFVTLAVMSEAGLHGSSLGGCFGVDFMDYIFSYQSGLRRFILPNVNDAMVEAHGKMFGIDSYDRARIRVEVTEGSVGLTVPGDACGINTGFHSHKPGDGSEFSCHNVDNPLQSLTLLAGIASLVGQVGFFVSAREKAAVTA